MLWPYTWESPNVSLVTGQEATQQLKVTEHNNLPVLAFINQLLDGGYCESIVGLSCHGMKEEEQRVLTNTFLTFTTKLNTGFAKIKNVYIWRGKTLG